MQEEARNPKRALWDLVSPPHTGTSCSTKCVLLCLSFAFLAPSRGCATPKGSAKDDGQFLLLLCSALLQLGAWSSETSCHQDTLPNVTVAVTSVTTTWSNFLVLSIQRGWIQAQSRSVAGGFIFVFAAKSSSGVRAFLLRLHRRRLLRICLFVGG